jgi:hypothetical protein
MLMPDIAADAVRSLESNARSANRPLSTFRGSRAFGTTHVGEQFYQDFLARLIRQSVHVSLPFQGTVYRNITVDSHWDAPSIDELDSLAGLPAPITCFSFRAMSDDLESGTHFPVDIVLVVIDCKQAQPDDADDGVILYVAGKRADRLPYWCAMDFYVRWRRGEQCAVLTFDGTLVGDDPDMGMLMPAIECCHALRAGATLQERAALSELKRRILEKKGYPTFTYHELRLPGHVGGAVLGGHHDSPRFHVRRAHIRKLHSGDLTFVRQCFVGDPERGLVAKHYAVSKSATA